ncbi:hypothetical protein BC936DRAFT_145667 [Jimgerdemannia flammicorona]|uniref:Uncharacterized protein n=2 Tax=Jimgerdemannia flammicorona TaxID=994334 RepID=A0A433D9H5_9FUNG|nr:hypothetical protein BC936DRAFT_145667 [Jimgerdemannia flammicorona]RUS24183.1 hypothetical protein BC938DRAFT_473985 [Jimgerdemannia flammicorona]
MANQTSFMDSLSDLWDESSTVLMELLASEEEHSPKQKPFLVGRREFVTPTPLRQEILEDVPLETNNKFLNRAIAFLYSWEPEDFEDEVVDRNHPSILKRARNKLFKNGHAGQDDGRFGLQRRGGSFKAYQGKTRQRSGSFPPVVIMHDEYL